jgi:hypothetical protein
VYNCNRQTNALMCSYMAFNRAIWLSLKASNNWFTNGRKYKYLLLQGFLGITYPLILLQRRISLQMVVLSTSFVYFLEFSNSRAIYRNIPKQTLVVPTSKSEEKTFMQIEHYGQKKLRFHRTFLNSVQL